MVLKYAFALILCVKSPSLLGSSKDRILPKDQSHLDPSFNKLKKDLIEACKKKNSEEFRNLVDSNTIFSFGAADARKSPWDNFKDFYFLESDTENTFFWKEFKQVLELGCVKSGEIFECPYVYSGWKGHKYGPFQAEVAVGKRVAVYRSPNIKSQILNFLDFNIVKILESNLRNWKKVEISEGQIGYVLSEKLRSPIDYRAAFKKSNGVWKLKYFIAGD